MTGMRPLPVPGWFLAFAAAVLGVACEFTVAPGGNTLTWSDPGLGTVLFTND